MVKARDLLKWGVGKVIKAVVFGMEKVIVDGVMLHSKQACRYWRQAQKAFVALLNFTVLKLLADQNAPSGGVALMTRAHRYCASIPTPLASRFVDLAAKIAFQHYRRWAKSSQSHRPPFFRASHSIVVDRKCGLRVKDNAVRFLLGAKGSELPREVIVVVNIADNHQRRVWEKLTSEWIIKQVQIGQNQRGRWVLRFVYEASKVETQTNNDEVVGVDIGLKHFLVADTFPPQQRPFVVDGDFFIGRWKEFRQRLRRLQRAATLIADGRGRQPVRRLLRRLQGRMRQWRQTVIYQMVNALVRWAKNVGAGTLVLEDLTGLREEKWDHPLLTVFPYYQFRLQLEHVAQREGLQVVFVEPYKTSSVCAICGAEVQRNDDRTVQCPACGWKGDRDVNAARLLARLWKEGKGQVVEVPSWLQRKRVTAGRRQRGAKK